MWSSKIGLDRLRVPFQGGQVLPVDAEAREHVLKPGAAGIHGVGEVVHGDVARHQAAAQGGEPEPAGFLSHEADAFQRNRQGHAALFDGSDRLEGPDDPHRAVISPSLDDRIQVRPGQHRGSFLPRRQPSEDVADRVHVHVETGLVHQVDQQLTGSQLVDGEDQPRDRAALAQTDARDRVEVAQQPIFIDFGDFHPTTQRVRKGVHGSKKEPLGTTVAKHQWSC